MSELARRLASWRAWALRASVDELAGAAGLARTDLVVPLTAKPVSCVDLRARGAEARHAERPLAVDVSACAATSCLAVRLGAHLALADVGEGLCVASVSRDVERVLPGICERLDALAQTRGCREADALEALAHREAWWHAASDEAQVVAAYLRCHPRVSALCYPGLRGDPSFEIAARTLQGGFGPYVDFRLETEASWRRVTCGGEDPRETVLSLERALSGGGGRV